MLELNVKTRTTQGKKVQKLRKEGFIPGVVYGPGIESFAVEVPYNTFEKIYKEAGPGTLVGLKIEGIEKKNNFKQTKEDLAVLIHEPARDVVTDKFIHVDFYKVRLDREIQVSIPLVFDGEAPAVEELGGTLVRNIHEVTVEGLPHKLPKEIAVDISKLKTFEDKILISDVKAPGEVTITDDPENTVAFVEEPREAEELEELEERPEEEVEKVEVEGEKEAREKEADKGTGEKEGKNE